MAAAALRGGRTAHAPGPRAASPLPLKRTGSGTERNGAAGSAGLMGSPPARASGLLLALLLRIGGAWAQGEERALAPARHGGGEAAGDTRRIPGPGEQPERVLPLPQHPGCCWGPSGACSEGGGREEEMGLSAGGNNELSRRVLCDLGAKRWNIRLCYQNGCAGGCWSDP